MSQTKAKRSHITIAGIEVEVFQLPNGDYVMSQTQASEAVGKHRSSMLEFCESKGAKVLLGEDFQCRKILTNDSPRAIQAIPLKMVSAYWLKESARGNKFAEALMYACIQEALERRCDAVFVKPKAENEYEASAKASYDDYWMHSRDFAKRCHAVFNQACYKNRFDPPMVHDELTMLVTGMRASEHRKLAWHYDDPTVGLNHVVCPRQLQVIARAKLNFATYRVGTAVERVYRAVEQAKQSL